MLQNLSFLSFCFLPKLLPLSSFQSKKTEQSFYPSLKYELQRNWVKRKRIKRWAEAPATLKSFVIAFSDCLLGIHSQSVWGRHSSRRGAWNGSQMHRKTSLKPLPVIPKNISSAMMGECFFPACVSPRRDRALLMLALNAHNLWRGQPICLVCRSIAKRMKVCFITAIKCQVISMETLLMTRSLTFSARRTAVSHSSRSKSASISFMNSPVQLGQTAISESALKQSQNAKVTVRPVYEIMDGRVLYNMNPSTQLNQYSSACLNAKSASAPVNLSPTWFTTSALLEWV